MTGWALQPRCIDLILHRTRILFSGLLETKRHAIALADRRVLCAILITGTKARRQRPNAARIILVSLAFALISLFPSSTKPAASAISMTFDSDTYAERFICSTVIPSVHGAEQCRVCLGLQRAVNVANDAGLPARAKRRFEKPLPYRRSPPLRPAA